MAIAIACSKKWDNDLINKLKRHLNIDVFLISKKEELTEEHLTQLNVSKVFFPHWSYIIKPAIFNKFECVIFHMTDLPYGRGGSPLQNLIVRGHEDTKISALKCSQGVDTGPVYLKRDLSLLGSAQEIYERATKIIEEMIIEIMEKNPTPVEQSGNIVEFQRRKEENGNLEKLEELKEIYDYIRMLDADGYPNAFIEINKIKYEFHSASFDGSNLEAKVRIVKK